MGFVVWLQSVMTENDAASDTDIFPSGWSSDILVPALIGGIKVNGPSRTARAHDWGGAVA